MAEHGHRRRDRDRDRDRGEERDSEFVDKLVHINRIAKVVKGGRRFGFPRSWWSATGAAASASATARRAKCRSDPQGDRGGEARADRVPLKEGRTLHHDVAGRMAPARFPARRRSRHGIIAGGPMRAVFETLGLQDIVAKSMGTSNPYNMVRATFDALKREDSPRSVAARRGSRFGAAGAPPHAEAAPAGAEG